MLTALSRQLLLNHLSCMLSLRLSDRRTCAHSYDQALDSSGCHRLVPFADIGDIDNAPETCQLKLANPKLCFQILKAKPFADLSFSSRSDCARSGPLLPCSERPRNSPAAGQTTGRALQRVLEVSLDDVIYVTPLTRHSGFFKPYRRTIRERYSIWLSTSGVSVSPQSGDPVEFVRRPNENGSVESICLSCFHTVGPCSTTTQLDSEERKHVCDPQAAEHFGALSRALREYRRQAKRDRD